MLSRVGTTFFKEYMLAMALPTTPWSKSSSDTFDVDDGGCFGCCCLSCAFFSSTNFWAVDLLTPVTAAVLSHTRFSDSFIPDLFSSMQNLYTFAIIAPASSLYLHTSLAILLSEVALHVHNTSKHAFFCKHVNRKKNPASLRKQKKKFYWGSNPQPWAQTLNFVFEIFEYNRYTYCAIEFIYTIFKEVYTFIWNSHSTKWPSITKLYTSKHYLQIAHVLKGCMDALNSSNTSLKLEIAHSLKIIWFIIITSQSPNSCLIPSDRRRLNRVWAFAQNNKGPADHSKRQGPDQKN